MVVLPWELGPSDPTELGCCRAPFPGLLDVFLFIFPKQNVNPQPSQDFGGGVSLFFTSVSSRLGG